MAKRSPYEGGESSRQYDRLLRGEISSKKYVKSLKKDARSQVANARSSRRRAA